MTAVGPQARIWNTMPGWGIVADLTPPELTASRRLAVIRKALLAGMVSLLVLLVLLVLLYGYTAHAKHVASNDLAEENSRTSQLLAEQHRYSDVTQLHASMTGIDAKIATLMTADVGFASTIGSLRSALPPTMALDDIEVKISPAGALAVTAGSAQAGTASSLDTSGHKSIGQVILNGSGHSLDDLPAYLANLRKITGVIDVVPVSNEVSGPSVQFNVTLSLTDEVLTHRFDASKVTGR
jgi:hypothetical protein